MMRAQSWFEKFKRESGDDAPDEERIYLPYCWRNLDIYLTYQAEMRNHGIQEDSIISRRGFFWMWERYFSNVCIAKVFYLWKIFQTCKV